MGDHKKGSVSHAVDLPPCTGARAGRRHSLELRSWEMTHPQRFQVAFPAPKKGQGFLNFGRSKKHPGVVVEMQTPEVKEVRPQIFYARGPQTSVGQGPHNEIRAIAEGLMSSDSA